ncbi:hypothetical protein LTR95_013972 [Oleoguttula sp. CCFEE 5521]
MGISTSRIETGMRDSSLNGLPAELRNAIWECVFAGVWDDITIKLLRKPEVNILMPYPGGHPRLALLQTCRQINREAAGFAWTQVRAILDCDDPTLDCPTTDEGLDAWTKERIAFLPYWRRMAQKQQPLHLMPSSRLTSIAILEVTFSQPRTLSYLNGLAVRDIATTSLTQVRSSFRVSDALTAITCLSLYQGEAVLQSKYGIRVGAPPVSRLTVDETFKELLKVMPLLESIDIDSEEHVGRFRYEKQKLTEQSPTSEKLQKWRKVHVIRK